MSVATSAFPASPGLHGFDTDEKLTAKTAKGLREAGFAFAIRYLSRKPKPPADDLTAVEVDLILDAGLALMAVQHVAKAGWSPSEELGGTNGRNAAAHALAVGLPPETSVWLDLEGVDDDTASEDAIAYCNAWFREVESVGYTSGIYVGSNCGLDSESLYWRLKTKRYWKSGSDVPDIPYRGYCLVQTIKKNDTEGGVGICRDVTLADAFGNTPILALRGERDAVIANRTLAAEVYDRSDEEAALHSLAAASQLGEPMEALIRFRNKRGEPNSARYWAIANLNLHSRFPRLFIFDVQNRSVRPYLCAHGQGSDRDNDGYANKFSNVENSNCTSLGVYSCGEIYEGGHRLLSMRLDGLESSNSNARSRLIVVHGADYVSDAWVKRYQRIGRSDGCFVVDYRYVTEIVEALHDGSLLIAWHGAIAAPADMANVLAEASRESDEPVWSEIEPLDFHHAARGEEAIASNTTVQLAQSILDSSRIVLARIHPSGRLDSATAYRNIVDTAAGRAANRSSYGTAPGGTVHLVSSMLQGLVSLADDYELSISELCGGEHSKNSRHYVGCAADIVSIDGQEVNDKNPYVAAFRKRCRDLGATEILGPGDPGHSSHVHAAWPRP
ncbi:murein L,D-transpeptidase catalytic domain family protein [Mesorhizobium sp. VK4C]|uniref:murein L,D-transpeptidase catalytic domain-containing protein n=1 Tax=Mesorhizobium captivum TaxID=3072319 RepID=UPI002A24D608|nr:murein L,D-transpeptidase catalytic domain family protein [Mesorhizobium sp. VK4C]MDX8501924.1 murein L,D-transpeptidase catalytic domain family protein [Mesorhizobium sp. VK4C]